MISSKWMRLSFLTQYRSAITGTGGSLNSWRRVWQNKGQFWVLQPVTHVRTCLGKWINKTLFWSASLLVKVAQPNVRCVFISCMHVLTWSVGDWMFRGFWFFWSSTGSVLHSKVNLVVQLNLWLKLDKTFIKCVQFNWADGFRSVLCVWWF